MHVQARCQDMTLNYEAWQQSNGKIDRERQNYFPSNTHLEGKLSSKYYVGFTGQFQWEMAGFFNGLLRKRAKASRIVYISW